MTDDDSTMLSRSGRTDVGDKKTQRIDVPVSDKLNDALGAMAAISGIPKAELGRQIWERVLFGEWSMVQRVASQAGIRQWDQSPINRD